MNEGIVALDGQLSRERDCLRFRSASPLLCSARWSNFAVCCRVDLRSF